MIKFEQITKISYHLKIGDRFLGIIRKIDRAWKYKQAEYQPNTLDELRQIAGKLEELNNE